MLALSIATAFVNDTTDRRLVDAQVGFLRGCLRFNIDPIFYTDPFESRNGRPKFGDILRLARTCARRGWMIWCNSDCELTSDPRFHLTESKCYGFHRREMPDGQICLGVDMYAIPVDLWDDYLSRDVPDMFIGATMIDWWITRACQKIDRYKTAPAILNHPRHTPATSTAGNMNDYNERQFRAWATRNQVDQGFQ